MYNRYIPQSDGSFQRNRMQDHRAPAAAPNQERPQKQPPCPPPSQDPPQAPAGCRSTAASGFLKQLLPKEFDTGDLLIVLLLLLMAGDCEEEKSNALLTLALYFFM